MLSVPTAQHRIIYSLLKPAARMAARFGVSVRILDDLMRLAYYEVLSAEHQLPNSEIARRFGQSERHIRSLAKETASDFFAAEREVGLPREIEALVAVKSTHAESIISALPSWRTVQIEAAIVELLEQGRLSVDESGCIRTAKHYVVLGSDTFPKRIDALNHFLSGATRAVLERLIFNNAKTAMIKTLTFAADPTKLTAFFQGLEGQLRTEIAKLDEEAKFGDPDPPHFTMSLNLSPDAESPDAESPKHRNPTHA